MNVRIYLSTIHATFQANIAFSVTSNTFLYDHSIAIHSPHEHRLVTARWLCFYCSFASLNSPPFVDHCLALCSLHSIYFHYSRTIGWFIIF